MKVREILFKTKRLASTANKFSADTIAAWRPDALRMDY